VTGYAWRGCEHSHAFAGPRATECGLDVPVELTVRPQSRVTCPTCLVFAHQHGRDEDHAAGRPTTYTESLAATPDEALTCEKAWSAALLELYLEAHFRARALEATLDELQHQTADTLPPPPQTPETP